MDYKRLLGAIVVCQLAGIIGSVFTVSSITTWYASLNKPWFTPPGWVFAPVWLSLYTLMGVALYLVWMKGLKTKGVRIAVYVFSAQLVLNTLWSILFFGLQNPFLAFVEICLLWAAIFFSIYYFYKVEKRAAYLLVPYILWTTLALVLNYTVWILN